VEIKNYLWSNSPIETGEFAHAAAYRKSPSEPNMLSMRKWNMNYLIGISINRTFRYR